MTAVATSPDLPFQLLDESGRPTADLPEHDEAWLLDLYVHMARVRCIDERMLKLQRAGRIGFVGSMLGMEAAMVGTGAGLRPQDWMWSGLREGGAALMRGLPLARPRGARCAITSSTRRPTTPAGRR